MIRAMHGEALRDRVLDRPLAISPEAYERIYSRVRLRLLRVIGPCEDLEDVLQSSMERLLKAWAGYRGEGSLEAFADGVALNVARLYLRRRSITKRIFDFFTEPIEQADRSVRHPGEETDSRARMRRLLELLDSVSPKKRIAFGMFYFEGKTVNAISLELGINRETVKARIFHARREIHDMASRDPVLKEWLDGA